MVLPGLNTVSNDKATLQVLISVIVVGIAKKPIYIHLHFLVLNDLDSLDLMF